MKLYLCKVSPKYFTCINCLGHWNTFFEHQAVLFKLYQAWARASDGQSENMAPAYRAIECLWALLKPSISYIVSSSVKPAKKLIGFDEIWAGVVLDIGLIYCKLCFRPGMSSRVGYPFQLCTDTSSSSGKSPSCLDKFQLDFSSTTLVSSFRLKSADA